MVALDDSCIAGPGFDDVRVDGALRQIVHRTDLLGLSLKNPDKFLADDLAFPLRLCHPCQLGQEALLSIDTEEVDLPAAESRLHLIALVLAHQAGIHKIAVS